MGLSFTRLTDFVSKITAQTINDLQVAAENHDVAIVSNTTAVARVDPGTTGAVGQFITIGPSGPTWLDSPYFNVKHPRFGAKGDGVTDDTAAVNAAIAALPSNGGTLFFPAGTYKITSAINLAKRANIVGAGREVTTILAVGCSGLQLVSPTDWNTVSHLIWSDFSLKGDYTAGKVGITLTSTHRWTLERLRVSQFASHGYASTNCYSSSLRDCSAYDNDGDGFNGGYFTNSILISGGHFAHNNGAGVRILATTQRAQQVTLEGVTIEGNYASGLVADYLDGLAVRGCYFEANDKSNTTPSGRTVPAGATVAYNVQLGFINSVRGVSLSGNYFGLLTATSNGGNHVALGSGSGAVGGADVAANSFIGPTTTHIALGANSSDIRIDPSNALVGAQTAPLAIRGIGSIMNGTTGTVLTHNLGRTNYIVTITPTGNLAGRWYVTKSTNTFTVRSTDATDTTQTFDWQITRAG